MLARSEELFPAGSVGPAMRPKLPPALSEPTYGLCVLALKVPSLSAACLDRPPRRPSPGWAAWWSHICVASNRRPTHRLTLHLGRRFAVGGQAQRCTRLASNPPTPLLPYGHILTACVLACRRPPLLLVSIQLIFLDSHWSRAGAGRPGGAGWKGGLGDVGARRCTQRAPRHTRALTHALSHTLAQAGAEAGAGAGAEAKLEAKPGSSRSAAEPERGAGARAPQAGARRGCGVVTTEPAAAEPAAARPAAEPAPSPPPPREEAQA